MFNLTRQLTLALLIVLCTSAALFAQSTARLQVIHNSPSPTVDIYVNGNKLLDNFAFRTATPYIDVPAGVALSIAVAPATSVTVADAIATFPATLEAGKRYIVVANGVVGNTTTPFTLSINDMGRETTTADNVDVAFFHGSPNAPAVDILAGTTAVFANTAFGRFNRPATPYVSLPANATYNLAVTPAGAPATVVGRYEANLSFWKGKTAVVMATGFLGSNDIDSGFEPWVVLSNGGTFPLKAISVAQPTPTNTARLQIIHNSPTPTVDIYVNGSKLLDNFAFRTATPYLEVPAGVTLNVGVGAATSTSVRDTLANFPFRLDSGKTYIVVANGVLGNATRPFRLVATDKGKMRSTSATNVDIAFFHGSPDAPAVDIRTGGNAIFANVSYGNFADYVSVPANATYNLAVTPAGVPTTVVGRYAANLEFWKGRSAVVFASGFLSSGSPAFEPWVALSNGGTFALPTTTNGFQNGQNTEGSLALKQMAPNELMLSPNPANESVSVAFNLQNDSEVSLQVVNIAGQTVRNEQFGRLPKGQNQFQLATGDLKAGYYLVRLQTADGVATKKLLIQQ